MNASILIVVTSHTALGDTGKPTGFWLEELAVPYFVFTRAGARVDLASPKVRAAAAERNARSSSHETLRYSRRSV